MHYAICLLLICCMCWGNDTIFITETNKLFPVVITKETFEFTYYCFSLDGRITAEQKIETRKILRVEHSKKNPHYDSAEALFDLNSYASAVREYQECLKSQDWTKQYALYKMGLCYQKLRKDADALKTFQKLLKEIPDTIFKTDVYWALGQAYLKSNNWKDAKDMFERCIPMLLQRNPLSPRIQECQYFQAFTVEKSGKYAEAIDLYSSILQQKTGITKEFRENTQLRVVECHNQLKQAKQAKKILAELVKSVDLSQKDLLAAIYMNYAKYYLADNKITEAMLCYMRIIIMYPDVPSVTKDAYQGAIYCADILKKDKPEYAARANQLRQMQQKWKK